MIYTKKDIEAEVIRYFREDISGNNEDLIQNTIQLVDSILSKTDILDSCHDIRDAIVNLSINGVAVYKDKKFLPTWVKYLVYVVIYEYLEENPKSSRVHNQTNLLKEMGLYGDIFGKKNWNMYSPDMKIRQADYQTLILPLNHAEVESNEIFRAMIHYMTCYSRVLTDTFVDMFGKLGLIPALCANGYASAQTWLNLKKYRELLVFVLALEKKVKVCKYLQELQYKIKHSDDEAETVSRFIGVATGLGLSIRQLSEDEIHYMIMNELNFSFDIYKFAAYFIVQQYFAPQYWMDSKLVKEENENGEVVLTAWLKDNLTSQRINEFVEEDFSEGIKELADAYKAKHFSVEHIVAKKAICQLYLETGDIYGINEYLNDTDLLYIDVPKYIREEKRFNFDIKYYKELFSVLSVYEGDWILAWKNYVEVTGARIENSPYSRLYTGNKIESSDEDYCVDDAPSEVSSNEMKALYEQLLEVSQKRQLYIFRYRDEDRNHPNSIIFITPIDFPLIDDKVFQKKYGIYFSNDGYLEKLECEKFYSNMMKFLSSNSKKK